MEYIVAALLALALIARITPKSWIALIPAAGAFILLASAAYITKILVAGSLPLYSSWTWSEFMGVSISFHLDGLSAIFGLLITVIGSGVFLYAGGYMKKEPRLGGFYATLLIFTAAMLGMVFSDHTLTFFVFWELTSICSYLLIGTNIESEKARQGARKALFVTAGGGLFLLLSLVASSLAFESLGLSSHDAQHFSTMTSSIQSHPYYLFLLGGFAIAVATKSAQLPFSFWLPKAMAGPTPVSSFLHSATMVKAGILLMAKLFPAFAGHPAWFYLFTSLGLLTSIWGAGLALHQKDLKSMLAYSTISILGSLVLLLGIGTHKALQAMVVLLIAHGLYKAAWFQMVGAIQKATGTKTIAELGGLSRSLPLLTASAILASLSMAGIPLLFGFFAKELMYFTFLGTHWSLLVGGFVGSLLMVGVAYILLIKPFFGSQGTQAENSLDIRLSLPPFIFGLISVAFALVPGVFDQYIANPFIQALSTDAPHMELHYWYGWQVKPLFVLGLSAVTLLSGWLLARHKSKFDKLIGPAAQRPGPEWLFDKTIASIPDLFQKGTRIIQSGSLPVYIKCCLWGLLAIVSWPLIQLAAPDFGLSQLEAIDTLLVLFITVPCGYLMFYQDHIKQVLMLGVIGLGIVVVFALFGAPDLALTQMMVESLSVIFLLFLIREMAPQNSLPSEISWPSLFLTGGLCYAFAQLALSPIQELPRSASMYFLEKSLPDAFGNNVVNVILVDFRALDTFGEVLAVSIAALGVLSIASRIGQRKGVSS
ncbi:hydrogen gas-evolving membrane-bound hydrogenase subunit E [Pseudobacteriovorax antillogorgiicola]|uniref:Multisubunit sodium/proton antiporter, MrpA subunit n=1 Tax=Pseudobacteriovorax antillogorgiicola TaxID=1513793 RepID=A0A1Y6CUV4_9BACT|nr:hydrogen gas-evolving membrane-bound hydrogenase subunit E [Pseudobacteriovorax antillogorgiicola]TCS43509.1 multisubunit sodium/proton antiporter MrpA subunit [Pseudobacteriovorax antillogorgiicola]SMF81102.1 multisubunit sodium/proton antiporter, MrpA subunit [Pseudobacteriovorax antillogorgiicola]